MIQPDTMTAAITVTTRVDEEVLQELDSYSTAKQMDRATYMRNLIIEGLTNEKKEQTLIQYRERKISLAKAAKILEVDLVSMLDIIKQEGIHLDYTEEELEEDLKGLR